jgi:methionyl-tRNA formyltransferase
MMQNNKPKIVFFGTPDFAATVLKALLDHEYNIAAVFTKLDKKVGRKQRISYSAVKDVALKNNIKVFQPNNLREIGVIREIREIGADLFIVAAYGKILPKEFLELPRYGAINVHGSLLPKYRGASPVQCAILEGEKETGVTLMRMNEKMDEGDILLQEKIKIDKKDTAETLMKKLAELGAKMMAKFVQDCTKGKIAPIPQDHRKATYCKPVRRDDGKINWNNAAEEIYREWRAYFPWPGIFSILKVKNQSKRLKLSEIKIILKNETGEKPGKIIEYNQEVAVQAKSGLIVLKKIQLEGKKEMIVSEFVRGNFEFIGSRLE